ncbi:retinoblastoma-related protein-like [Senna tora]|uniref:Retinoblastoma-related protein-like n=1 Tax=Senna tora TaxID=362788 RepID=A0A834W096_9FABA|nr:retinoblastoma-related protein-like [Senna tora]
MEEEEELATLIGVPLNIMDFFKELPQFVVKGPILSKIYGTNWENRLEQLIFLQDDHHIYVANSEEPSSAAIAKVATNE